MCVGAGESVGVSAAEAVCVDWWVKWAAWRARECVAAKVDVAKVSSVWRRVARAPCRGPPASDVLGFVYAVCLCFGVSRREPSMW